MKRSSAEITHGKARCPLLALEVVSRSPDCRSTASDQLVYLADVLPERPLRDRNSRECACLAAQIFGQVHSCREGRPMFPQPERFCCAGKEGEKSAKRQSPSWRWSGSLQFTSNILLLRGKSALMRELNELNGQIGVR